MHHTMADGSFDHFLDAYAHVTAANARRTPRNAATEIDRLMLTAWREKLPVYMELRPTSPTWTSRFRQVRSCSPTPPATRNA